MSVDTATVADMVEEVRSLVSSSQADELSVLLSGYVPGSQELRFRYPKKNLTPGTVVCVGLNTFYVVDVGADGSSAVVLERYDGGPVEAVPAGAIARFKPRHSTWAIFRELTNEIRALASPVLGIWQPFQVEYDADRMNETYDLPPELPQPLRLLAVRVRLVGRDERWVDVSDAEFLPGKRQVRLPEGRTATLGASRVTLVFAIPISVPTSLDDSLAVLGFTETTRDIPPLGAASTLVMGWEGRRVQPFAQGDARRAEEVTVGSSTALAREWRRRRDARIDEEHARLVREFPWQQQTPNNTDATYPYGFAAWERL